MYLADPILATITHGVHGLISGIQAWASAIQAISTVVTFIVLCIYGFDTHKIAKASQNQRHDIEMPFLALVSGDRNDFRLENQGKGPAINIQYDGFNDRGFRVTRAAKPMSPGGDRELSSFNKEHLEKHPFYVRYESLGGLKYSTVVTHSPNQGSGDDEYDVKFVRGH